MAEKEFYYTINKAATAECKDRGSLFIANAFPLEIKNDFKTQLATVKAAHSKATHHCFAYRLGLDGTDFRLGDDGEPSGTAGKPILAQIDSKELTNILVIVTRYFGGSLLGMPGLINAYKTAASLVLQLTPIVQKQIEISYCLQFGYTIMNDVMAIIKQHHCTVISQEIQLFCNIVISIPLNREDSIINRLRDIRNVELTKL